MKKFLPGQEIHNKLGLGGLCTLGGKEFYLPEKRLGSLQILEGTGGKSVDQTQMKERLDTIGCAGLTVQIESVEFGCPALVTGLEMNFRCLEMIGRRQHYSPSLFSAAPPTDKKEHPNTTEKTGGDPAQAGKLEPTLYQHKFETGSLSVFAAGAPQTRSRRPDRRPSFQSSWPRFPLGEGCRE